MIKRTVKTLALGLALGMALLPVDPFVESADAQLLDPELVVCAKPGSTKTSLREECRTGEREGALALCVDQNDRLRARGGKCRRKEHRLSPAEALSLVAEPGLPGPGGLVSNGDGGGLEKPEWDIDCYETSDEVCCSWIVYYPSIDESSAGFECAKKD